MSSEELVKKLLDSLESIGQHLQQWFSAHSVNIIAILLGAYIIRRFGIEVLNRLLKHTVRPDIYPSKADRDKRIKTLNSLISAGMRVSVYIIAGILIIGEINPSYTTALFASAGLITVALGFGAQSLIRDFASGIFIITENQYRIGDEVMLTAGAGIGTVSGIVEDLTIRTTVLRDLDGNVHHMPNGNISVTTNKTLGYSRLNEDVTVAIDTKLDRLEHVINHVGEQVASLPELEHKVLQAPYMASVKAISNEGLVVKILAKTAPADQWLVRSEFFKRLPKAFADSDILWPSQAKPSKK